MEILILKSAACLAILMIFYKLFLEKLAIHKFKRFYLLGALVVSLIIPFITFIEYIEPQLTVPYFKADHSIPLELIPTEEIITEEPTNYLPILLWSLYGLGALLFLSKFCFNLYSIIAKINKNEKQKHNNFISVLLNDLIVPHTFFSYIFLNKTKFEAKAIPQEVILHEQTHANQKHSLDILFIELLQVIFWFNPLLYFIKKDIKLNHEFLADDAVLKQGIDSSTYQETLLQFTSNANQVPLAHAINYSLIKKRFTIMKTQTSRKAIWLRSLLLVPLLGGLLFNFSGREQIEKDVVPAMVLQNPILTVNGITCDGCQLNLSKEGVEKIILGTTTGDKISTFNIKFPGKPTVNIKGVNLNAKAIEYLSETSLGLDVQLFVIKTVGKQKLSPIKITLVNKEDKNYSHSPMVKKGEASLIPPPPPPAPLKKEEIIGTEAGFIKYMKQAEANKDAIFYNGKEITAKEATAIYKKAGKIDILTQQIGHGEYRVQLSDAKGAATTIKAENLTKGNTPLVKKGEASLIPPPPPPAPLRKEEIIGTEAGFIKYMKQAEANKDPIFYNGKEITAKEATAIYKKAGKIDILTQHIGQGKYKVNLSDAKGALTTIKAKNLVMTNARKVKKGEASLIPPPPPPAPLRKEEIIGTEAGFIKYMKQTEANKDAIFYNGKEITAKEATAIYKKAGKIDILTQQIGRGEYRVQLSDAKGAATTIKAENLIKSNTQKLSYSQNEVQTAFVTINGSTHYKVIHSGNTKYYNRKGYLTDSNGKVLSNNPVNGDQVIPGQNISQVYKDNKVVVEFKKTGTVENTTSLHLNRKQTLEALKEDRKALLENRKEERKAMLEERKEMLKNRRSQIRRPLYEQFKGMEANGTTFFYEGEKISEAKAIELTKENPKLNMSMQNNNGVSTVHLSKKGITTVNGKLVKKEE
ncbi:M56 family metallopeptidase [uncultured Lacinutrix sp.]|uniref:M56 family metallopeptidase n=1 Tax=uncultured Lacinutrix sp. TaxID=574032 RepID=UPI00260793D1|nr:M56 family metallopeptidase [uncultured Lacinutrix sp.]